MPPPRFMLEAEGAPAVECRGIVKDFSVGERAVRVLHGVDFSALYGELSLLVGPSGSGKTTLLSIIGGILSPTMGRITITGMALDRIPERKKTAFRRDNIGFIFQQYNLLPALTAAENAAVPLVAAGRSMPQARRAAQPLLERLGLAPQVDKHPAQLSGGEQQRVAIARALVHDPQLVLCDEPTAALDAANGATVMAMLREIAVAPERAVIVVTHDSRIVSYADRVSRIEDGRIVAVESVGLP